MAATRKQPRSRQPAAKRLRAKKQPSPPRTASEIAALASRLRELADQIDQCAQVMRRQRIPAIRPLTGNFHIALDAIRRFVNRQMLPQVADAAHETFRTALLPPPAKSRAPRPRA